ncbi:MAG: tetratricopeptide repeat protein [Coleofasciculaceae cyanobacterium RL_1_1]|nr:tetratricopeptide repeat protein [Coleofasciculaceae cyanobacterium RL_1_1]
MSHETRRHGFRWVGVLRSCLAKAIVSGARQCEARRYLRLAAGMYRWARAISPLHTDPTLTTMIGCAYAEVLVQLECWNTAIAVYTQVTEHNPNHAVAWFRLSGLLAHVRGYEAAIDSYLAAVRCDPTRQWFYHPLLWDVLATTGQLPRLEADLITVLDRRGETMSLSRTRRYSTEFSRSADTSGKNERGGGGLSSGDVRSPGAKRSTVSR